MFFGWVFLVAHSCLSACRSLLASQALEKAVDVVFLCLGALTGAYWPASLWSLSHGHEIPVN